MSTRNIKDAKDLSTGELIYFKGHAQATFMSDGRTVEEAVSGMSGGSGEDSDIFILDLFGVAGGYPDVDDITNTGTIEFTVDSELMSMIDSAIQKNKLVIRVDYVDLYNLEIDAYNSTRSLFIRSHFEYMGEFVQIYMWFSPSELSGGFSISTVNTGSGGSSDTSDCVKTLIVGMDGLPRTPDADGVIDLSSNLICNSITVDGQTEDKYKYSPAHRGNIDLGYIRKQLVESMSSSMTLKPNIYYRNTSTSLSTLTITFASETSALYNSLILNEYFVEFTTSSSGTAISLPSTIKWANGETPTFEASTTYQISIVNNLGVVTKFK